MRHLAITALLITAVASTHALPPPPAPQFEFRGAWIASVHNIDWPSKPGLSTAAQQAELIAILDRATALRLNALFLQVRPAGDAIYRSSIEPWSPWFTGEMGKAPSPAYDPLDFALHQAHRRGIQLHAWFNPFRALASTTRFPASPDHITRRHSQWTKKYASTVWMDPGVEGVRQQAIAVITDVARRYDVDGIHIDDYFYPYPVKGQPFNDTATYRAYTETGGSLPLAEWRRQNMNGFIRDLYSAVKRTKPQIAFSISPFGYWKPDVPETIQGELDPYESLAADVRHWLHSGWVDFLVPQLYWTIQPPKLSFTTLYDWWLSENPLHRPIYAGIAIDRVGKDRDAGEILAQIDVTRTRTQFTPPGQVHWNWRALRNNKGRVTDRIQKERYTAHALVPPLVTAPAQPPLPAPVLGAKGTHLYWTLADPATASRHRFWFAQTWDGTRWHTFAPVPAEQRSAILPEKTRAVSLHPVSTTGHIGQPAVLELR